MGIKLCLFIAICAIISIAEGNDTQINGEAPGLFVENTYQKTADSQLIYIITIKNSGDITIRDMVVEDILPANMAYVRSSYLFTKDGILGVPAQNKKSDGINLAWLIGDLLPNQSKIIQLTVAGNGDAAKSKVIASGSALGIPVVTLPREAQHDIGPLG